MRATRLVDVTSAPFAQAFVDSVLAAGEVQARRIERDGSTLTTARMLEEGAALGRFERLDKDALRKIAAKGGSRRKISPEEIAAREALKAKSAARKARNAEIVRMFSAQASDHQICHALGLSRGVVTGVIARHRRREKVAGRTRGVKGPGASAMKIYGLSPEEFQDYGVIRGKGYSSAEAADIVLRSRRPAKTGAP